MRILGQSMDLLINDKVLACAKEFTLQVSSGDIECSSPDSGIWKDYEPVLNEWQLTAQHLYTFTQENFQELFNYVATHQSFTVKMWRTDEEGYQYIGTAHITSLQLGAILDQPVGINFVLRGRGELLSEQIFKLWATEDLLDLIVDENSDSLLI